MSPGYVTSLIVIGQKFGVGVVNAEMESTESTRKFENFMQPIGVIPGVKSSPRCVQSAQCLL